MSTTVCIYACTAVFLCCYRFRWKGGLSLEWKSEGVMDDESGESMEPMEEMPLVGLGEWELDGMRGWRREAGSWFQRRGEHAGRNDLLFVLQYCNIVLQPVNGQYIGCNGLTTLIIHHPSLFHSRLIPPFSANPSHRSLPFFSRTGFTDSLDCLPILLYTAVFYVVVFSCFPFF